MLGVCASRLLGSPNNRASSNSTKSRASPKSADRTTVHQTAASASASSCRASGASGPQSVSVRQVIARARSSDPCSSTPRSGRHLTFTGPTPKG